MSEMTLVLASTSTYRRQLVDRLGIAVEQIAPACDEEALKTELQKQNKTPATIAEELSLQKGLSVLKNSEIAASTLILSGDQLVSFQSEILGKPGTIKAAEAQLRRMRGHWHELITSAHLFAKDEIIAHTEIVRLKMRHLSDEEIRLYVEKDRPLDCAGSYKIESRGMALFEKIEATDFTTIQGLPMIWLTTLLKEHNYELFKH
jgi:septum formation protein